MYDEEKNEFSSLPGGVFSFEHSLRSLSKWESKWRIFLIGNRELTMEQLDDYFYMMCLDDNFSKVYITNELRKVLKEYMEDSHTATILPPSSGGKKQTLTSELIYAYMAMANIPFECEVWNISRLITTIACVGILQNPNKKKMGVKSTVDQYMRLNSQRLKKYKTKG